MYVDLGHGFITSIIRSGFIYPDYLPGCRRFREGHNDGSNRTTQSQANMPQLPGLEGSAVIQYVGMVGDKAWNQ
jgi:hypothetical protein